MKFILALIFIVMLTPQHTQARHIKIYTFNGSSSRQKPVERGCLDSVPLGCVTFKTAQTWTVGSQVWSDVVMATGCKKTAYDGGAAIYSGEANYKADCRQNTGYGDLFSWNMVNAHKSKLCPDGWRVPTKEDFAALDVAIRGSGAGTDTYNDATTRDKYILLWGGSYGGVCYVDGLQYELLAQGGFAYYWSQSEGSEDQDRAYFLRFGSDSYIYPNFAHTKDAGFMLRCVR